MTTKDDRTMINIRVRESTKKDFTAAAAKEEMGLSAWLRALAFRRLAELEGHNHNREETR